METPCRFKFHFLIVSQETLMQARLSEIFLISEHALQGSNFCWWLFFLKAQTETLQELKKAHAIVLLRILSHELAAGYLQ